MSQSWSELRNLQVGTERESEMYGYQFTIIYHSTRGVEV